MKKLSRKPIKLPKYPKRELTAFAVFECGLCFEQLAGGRVSLVTHAVHFHFWQVKLVLDNAKYLGQLQQVGTDYKIQS